MTRETQIINIPTIRLEWSEWLPWNDLKIDARSRDGIRVPNKQPGVYEVRYVDSEERLTVGKASDLRHRVKQGLVKGIAPHSTGKRIRGNEDVSRLLVRWAKTDRPAATEEDLHIKYCERYGNLPKYTKHT